MHAETIGLPVREDADHPAQDAQSSTPVSHGGKSVAIAVGVFSLLSICAAFTSDGFLDADAATHFLYARCAFEKPAYLVSIWGRPLATALYAPDAALAGRPGVRMTSLLCAIVCALIAWRLAILQRYRLPALAAVFTLGQPLFFLHSFSEMTEIPFAMVCSLAFFGYRKRNWALLAVAAGLLPLGRPEGFGFCVLAGFALLVHRRYWWVLMLPLPVAIWSYCGWIVDWRAGHWWTWLYYHWPYASGSDYPPGPLLHFVLLLPMLVSPLAAPALLAGIAVSLRKRLLGPDHVARCQWLIAGIPLTALICHSLFHWLGKFSSNGELRYMLIVSPLWGLLVACGWEWLCSALALQRQVALAALCIVAPAQLNWHLPIVPMHLDPQWESARAVDWYKSASFRAAYPKLVFSHPAIDYFLNAPAADPIRSTLFNPQTVASHPSGYLLIWDSVFSGANSDPTRDVTIDQIQSAGWVEITPPSAVRAVSLWRLFLSPQPVAGVDSAIPPGVMSPR